MALIFNGRAFADQKIEKLKKAIGVLKSRGITPHLASILIGKDPASLLYVNLKKKKAEEIGAKLSIYKLSESTKIDEVLDLIFSLNSDSNIQGIMIQLPIPGPLSADKKKIIDSIALEKDVDGLRVGSPFLHPTSKAVIYILKKALAELGFVKLPIRVCVVGSGGMVGASLTRELKKEGFDVLEVGRRTDKSDKIVKSAQVVISATGEPGIIVPAMVKPGVIAIDVGSPRGDLNPAVTEKASFITPVPGGVGPVTISCLLENLIQACQEASGII